MAKKTKLIERGTGETLYPVTTSECVLVGDSDLNEILDKVDISGKLDVNKSDNSISVKHIKGSVSDIYGEANDRNDSLILGANNIDIKDPMSPINNQDDFDSLLSKPENLSLETFTECPLTSFILIPSNSGSNKMIIYNGYENLDIYSKKHVITECGDNFIVRYKPNDSITSTLNVGYGFALDSAGTISMQTKAGDIKLSANTIYYLSDSGTISMGGSLTSESIKNNRIIKIITNDSSTGDSKVYINSATFYKDGSFKTSEGTVPKIECDSQKLRLRYSGASSLKLDKTGCNIYTPLNLKTDNVPDVSSLSEEEFTKLTNKLHNNSLLKIIYDIDSKQTVLEKLINLLEKKTLKVIVNIDNISDDINVVNEIKDKILEKYPDAIVNTNHNFLESLSSNNRLAAYVTNSYGNISRLNISGYSNGTIYFNPSTGRYGTSYDGGYERDLSITFEKEGYLPFYTYGQYADIGTNDPETSDDYVTESVIRNIISRTDAVKYANLNKIVTLNEIPFEHTLLYEGDRVGYLLTYGERNTGIWKDPKDLFRNDVLSFTFDSSTNRISYYNMKEDFTIVGLDKINIGSINMITEFEGYPEVVITEEGMKEFKVPKGCLLTFAISKNNTGSPAGLGVLIQWGTRVLE